MNRYASRKFIVTLTGMFLTAILAGHGAMTPDVALVMCTCIGGYHAANAFVAGKGGK